MNKGRVYWITGLSNSGKTTIGSALFYELKKERDNVIILDGDLMKQIASGSEVIGYASQDRLVRAKRYSLIAKMLSDQGAWVIVCAIAMFDEIREWNRQNICGYIEVFLDVSEDVLKERDKKGLYTVQKDIQLPKFPDITINNDGTETIYSLVNKIRAITPQKEDDYDRDKEYWNEYYKSLGYDRIEPSDFAQYIVMELPLKSHILELGCGNGRDSLFFLDKGHDVIAVDSSNTAIDMLNRLTQGFRNAMFICDDFVKCSTLYQMIYDCIYSRFTLHAITDEQETELLNNVRSSLGRDGLFCIEARTIHDDICGRGTKVGHNAYVYNDHFRRFIDVNEFENKLKLLGFEIISLEEKTGLSKTIDSDPMLMRCIAKAKNRA